MLEKKTYKFSKRGIESRNLTTGNVDMATLSDFGKQTSYVKKSQTYFKPSVPSYSEHTTTSSNTLNRSIPSDATSRRMVHAQIVMRRQQELTQATNQQLAPTATNNYNAKQLEYRNPSHQPAHYNNRQGSKGLGNAKSSQGALDSTIAEGATSSRTFLYRANNIAIPGTSAEERNLFQVSRALRGGKLSLLQSSSRRREIKTTQLQVQQRTQRMLTRSRVKASERNAKINMQSNRSKAQFASKVLSYSSDAAKKAVSASTNDSNQDDGVGEQALSAVVQTAQGAVSYSTRRLMRKQLRGKALRQFRRQMLAKTRRAAMRTATKATANIGKKAAKRAAQGLVKLLSDPATLKGVAIAVILGAVIYLVVTIMPTLPAALLGGVVGGMFEENADPDTVSYIKGMDSQLVEEILDLQAELLASGAGSVEVYGLERIKTKINPVLALLTVMNMGDTEFSEKTAKMLSMIHKKLNSYIVESMPQWMTDGNGGIYVIMHYQINVESYSVRQRIDSFGLSELQKEILIILLEILDEEAGLPSDTVVGEDGDIIEGNGSLIFPLDNYNSITSPYGERKDPITGKPGEFHPAIDISAAKGTPIKSAAAGRVVFAGERGTYGNLVIVDHGNGMETYYAHCDTLGVVSGQSVSVGEVIATVGNTGRSTGDHLHFEVRVNDRHQNPNAFF